MARARSTRWLLVAIAAIVTSIAQPAAAASLDDLPHARGPLDLKRLVAFKHDAAAPLHVTVVTYGTWPANTDASGRNRIFIIFNPDHEGEREYTGEVFFRTGTCGCVSRTAPGRLYGASRFGIPRETRSGSRIPAGLPNPNGHAWIAVAEHWVTETGPRADICRTARRARLAQGDAGPVARRAKRFIREAGATDSSSWRVNPVCGCGWPRTGRR